jgi:dienelactone hydrolase
MPTAPTDDPPGPPPPVAPKAGLRRAALMACLGLDGIADRPDAIRDGAFTLLTPPQTGRPCPAVLYCHAHGGDHALGRQELTAGARWLAAPPAPDLLAAGWAVLCIDMPGFGARSGLGSESALAKAGLWQGRPLFGQMVAEQLAAARWLRSQPGIDARRIVALGTSMGGALALWAAALDPDIAAAAHLCMLADIGPLIASGAHDRHGPYLTVPGLLRLAETGDIAALIAPRPQFVAHGALDPLTPPKARDAALARLRAAYRDADRGAGLSLHLGPGTGHLETPAMRRSLLDFLQALTVTDKHTRTAC